MTRPVSDHPRSRGVYPLRSTSATQVSGSSPLARGLLPPRCDHDHLLGIIPARAGFTTSRAMRRSRLTDHPRSRGVYDEATAHLDIVSGSSPLARGLPHVVRSVGIADGIIPARAGFTRRRPSPDPCSPDHPRSRGVYTTMRSRFSEFTGSSPLARGLRRRGVSFSGPQGIIPARAGFTEKIRRTPTGGVDHPRSRGVYISHTGR